MEQAKKLVEELGEKIDALRDELFELEYKQYQAGVRLEILKFCNLPEAAYKWLKKRDCILSILGQYPHDGETYVKYDVTMKVGNNAFHVADMCPVHAPLSLRSTIMINMDGTAKRLSEKISSDQEADTYMTDRLNTINSPIADPTQPITDARWNDVVQRLRDDDIEFTICMRAYQMARIWLESEGNEEWSATSELSDIVFTLEE